MGGSSSSRCRSSPSTATSRGGKVSIAPPEWDDVEEALEAMVDDLGDVEFCRIRVSPFSIRLFDLDFGLIPRPPESDDDEWAVELMPGNSMCFFAPWDSGEYDT